VSAQASAAQLGQVSASRLGEAQVVAQRSAQASAQEAVQERVQRQEAVLGSPSIPRGVPGVSEPSGGPSGGGGSVPRSPRFGAPTPRQPRVPTQLLQKPPMLGGGCL
jgi:hypothetical protein